MKIYASDPSDKSNFFGIPTNGDSALEVKMISGHSFGDDLPQELRIHLNGVQLIIELSPCEVQNVFCTVNGMTAFT